MRRIRGFTLIELLVVMAIVGGLLAIAAPRYLHRVDLAKETTLKSDLATMRDALDKFFADTGRYPADLEELVARRYLRRIPPDPLTGSVQSWVKSGAKGATAEGRAYSEL
jgi:general secretion pathway protein G